MPSKPADGDRLRRSGQRGRPGKLTGKEPFSEVKKNRISGLADGSCHDPFLRGKSDPGLDGRSWYQGGTSQYCNNIFIIFFNIINNFKHFRFIFWITV